MFEPFDELVAEPKKAKAAEMETQKANHQVIKLAQIKGAQQEFPDRHQCSISHSHFAEIFAAADVFTQERAKEFIKYAQEQHQAQGQRDRFVSGEFVQNCEIRLKLLRKKRDELVKMLRQSQDLQVQYMARNSINPDTGEYEEGDAEAVVRIKEDMLCNYTFVKTTRKKKPFRPAGGTPHSGSPPRRSDSQREDGQEELGQEGEEEAAEYGEERLAPEALGSGRPPDRPADNPLYDLKPYFARVAEWDARILRLEQKMTCLDPELVLLSFELHEQGIGLLVSKINKLLKVEQLHEQREAEKAEQKDERRSPTKRQAKRC